jgi:hypothetical protein
VQPENHRQSDVYAVSIAHLALVAGEGAAPQAGWVLAVLAEADVSEEHSAQ